MALSLYSTPRLRKSEDSPKRYQVTHPSPARFVSPHPVEKERAQASVHVEDDDSLSKEHTEPGLRLPLTVRLYLVALFYAKESQ